MTTPNLTPHAPLDRAWIARRIPHQFDMCLLDAVRRWSPQAIECEAGLRGLAEHPLRGADARLSATHAIEYAAQAMAVHGALIADGPRPKRGYLVSVRSVEFAADRLDAAPAPLQIEAERLSGDSSTVLYQFHVRSDDRLLLSGRAAVILDSENL